jgi:hypothetical protein
VATALTKATTARMFPSRNSGNFSKTIPHLSWDAHVAILAIRCSQRQVPTGQLSQVRRRPAVDLGDRAGVVLQRGRAAAAVAQPSRRVLQVEPCREQLAGRVVAQRLDVQIDASAVGQVSDLVRDPVRDPVRVPTTDSTRPT